MPTTQLCRVRPVYASSSIIQRSVVQVANILQYIFSTAQQFSLVVLNILQSISVFRVVVQIICHFRVFFRVFREEKSIQSEGKWLVG